MRKNNKECTSEDCLKPSGLINWIRCDCCSSWYLISCVNISLSDSKKTQWFQCPLCVDVQSVNKATIGNDLLLDNDVNTAISNVRVLKRVPKNSRVPLAESLSDKINDIVYNVEDVTKWLISLTSFLLFLEQPKKSGRKQTTSMSSLINKKIRANDLSLPKPHPQVLSPPLSDLEQRIKLITSKLDEGNNEKRGIRLAASDDKITPFSTDNYQKLLSKHPQRAKFAAPNPENSDSFFVTDFDLDKAILSFPNGSAAGPDKIVPQIFKDLVSKSNGSAGLNFLKSLTKLINLIGDGKIPEPLRPFFFGAKLIALIKIDIGLRPIAIGNTRRRIASKCAGSKALSERQNFFGNVQVGCGTKRVAEIAAHSFRNLIERDDNPKCTVLLKVDFRNAFNSLN